MNETFSILADFLHVGTMQEDLVTSIRVLSPPRPANDYVVFFYPMPDGVEIAAVIHGSRDWIMMFARGEHESKN